MTKRGWVLVEKETGELDIDALGYTRFAAKKAQLLKLFPMDGRKPVRATLTWEADDE